MFKQLHDFITENYRQGNFDTTYTTRTKEYKKSDYQLGYQQAEHDYQVHRSFCHYPAKIIRLLNKITHGRINEVENYICGYNDAKVAILHR